MMAQAAEVKRWWKVYDHSCAGMRLFSSPVSLERLQLPGGCGTETHTMSMYVTQLYIHNTYHVYVCNSVIYLQCQRCEVAALVHVA